MFIALLAITLLTIWSKNHTRSNAVVKARATTDRIVIGHSHPECAFNDSLIEGLQNFSRSGESYFYTYYKLIPLLAQNARIKTVFIDFSNDMISAEKNDWTWGQRYLTRSYAAYGPFIDASGNRFLFTHNPKAFLDAQSLSVQASLMSFINHDYDYSGRLGKYVFLERNQTDSLLKAGTFDYVNRDQLFELSTVNLTYLRKMIDYTRSLNRKVYLLRSPMHKSSPYLLNESLFRKVYDSLFKDVEFLDYVNFPLENNEYGNLEHLNFRGAKKFSEFFNQEIRKY